MPRGWEPADPHTQAVIFDEWSWMLRAGGLPAGILRGMQLRLRYGEFEPGPARLQLEIMVVDALAAELGVNPADVPGSPLAVPGDPGGLEDDRRDW